MYLWTEMFLSFSRTLFVWPVALAENYLSNNTVPNKDIFFYFAQEVYSYTGHTLVRTIPSFIARKQKLRHNARRLTYIFLCVYIYFFYSSPSYLF
jgi:hypothetical protein